MSGNLEKELPVPSGMGQLAGLRAAERQAAEDKRACVEGEFLLSGVALLAGKVDRFELPVAALRSPVPRQNCIALGFKNLGVSS
jgi:hypothetical protein